MNTKRVPSIIMLLAGAVTCIVTYLNGYEIKDTLIILIWVLIIFLIIGCVVKKILDSFHMPDEDAVGDEGEVIEKTGEEGAEGESEAEGAAKTENKGETEEKGE
ncbi:MAG: hypothetical protein Q4G60_02210 [bacterium]|nr:hypothetical protein [bacterium]